MNRPGRIGRSIGALLASALTLAGLSACGPDATDGGRSWLFIRNTEIAEGLDSLHIRAVGAGSGDTVMVYRWHKGGKGEKLPSEIPYPEGLEEPFTLLTQGYQDGEVIYQSRAAIAGGQSRPPVRDFRLVAPSLPDAPLSRSARVRDPLVLRAPWEVRPGIFRQTDSAEPEVFTPEADLAWTRQGELIGTDDSLVFPSLALADSGTYLFQAGNRAGEDSLAFRLEVRHMLPRIAAIGSREAPAGGGLTVIPVVTHSDSLLYRWTRQGSLASTDSILAFDTLRAEDTGTWRLTVANASDTAEKGVSNPFTVRFRQPAWNPEKTIQAGAQAHSSRGTALDLDVAKAMLHPEAVEKEALIDLLFVYSGGALKLMSAVAAKQATDLSYDDDFEAAKIVNVLMVRAAAKPANPAAARAAYEAATTKANAFTVAAGQGFLLRTTDGYIAWVSVGAIQNAGTAAAGTELTVALGSW